MRTMVVLSSGLCALSTLCQATGCLEEFDDPHSSTHREKNVFTRSILLNSSSVAFLTGACQSSFMLDEGIWAEVRIGGEHLHLFAEHNALGVQASVYNVKAKSWIAPSEPVDDIQQGKARAMEHAEAYLKQAANVELPLLEWKQARSI